MHNIGKTLILVKFKYFKYIVYEYLDMTAPENLLSHFLLFLFFYFFYSITSLRNHLDLRALGDV